MVIYCVTVPCKRLLEDKHWTAESAEQAAFWPIALVLLCTAVVVARCRSNTHCIRLRLLLMLVMIGMTVVVV